MISVQKRKTVKQTRPRDAAATRADLLKAARVLFSRHGYEMVGLRQLAAEVGVNQALVIRYFGSKKELFAEAIEGLFSPHRWFEGDRETIGWQMAASQTAEWPADWPTDQEVNPLTLLIQSCGHPQANDVLLRAFDDQAIKPIAAWLEGPNALERAGVLAAIIVGTGVVRQLIRSSALTNSNRDAVVAALGAALQRVVDNEIPERPPVSGD